MYAANCKKDGLLVLINVVHKRGLGKITLDFLTRFKDNAGGSWWVGLTPEFVPRTDPGHTLQIYVVYELRDLNDQLSSAHEGITTKENVANNTL